MLRANHDKLIKRHTAALAIPVILLCYSAFRFQSFFTADFSGDGKATAANVIYSSGDIKRRPLERFRWFNLGGNAKLFENDSIRVSADSKLTIRMNDGSEIEIGERSLVSLEKRDGEISIRATGGRLRFKAGKKALRIISNGQTLHAQNSSGTIEDTDGRTAVRVTEGKAELKNPNGRTLSVTTTQSAQVSKEGLAQVGKFELADPFEKPAAKPPQAMRVLPALLAGSLLHSNRDHRRIQKDPLLALRWIPYPGAVAYRVKVRSPAGKESVQNVSPEDSALEIKPAFNQPLNYSIEAILENGDAIASSKQNLELHFDPPLVRSPIPGMTIRRRELIEKMNERIVLSWENTSFTEAYELEIAEDPGFKRFVRRFETQNNFFIFQNIVRGTYFWRVKSRSSHSETESTFSPPSQFTITD